MSDDLRIIQGSKEEKYQALMPQIAALIGEEPDQVANLANIAGALKEQFDWLWIGFYLVKKDELVLGPFQGPVACTRIARGRGVCGTAWQEMRTLIVADTDAFPGHISCNSQSRSEIVIPLIRNQQVVGVLDADSKDLSAFDSTDQHYLEQIASLIRW